MKKGPCKSVEGNLYVAVYAAACQWARAYPLKREQDVSDSLKWLFRHVGFPRVIRPDDAQSLTGGEFKRVANKAQVPIHPSEAYNPNQNLAEDCIREATKMYTRFMTARNIPQAFWDRVFVYCLELRSHMVLGHSMQEEECDATIISGDIRWIFRTWLVLQFRIGAGLCRLHILNKKASNYVVGLGLVLIKALNFVMLMPPHVAKSSFLPALFL